MEDENNDDEIFFNFLNFRWFLGIQLQNSSPSFDKVSELE